MIFIVMLYPKIELQSFFRSAPPVHDKEVLEHSSKFTNYELQRSYDDLAHEYVGVLKTAKLPRECNEAAFKSP